MSLEINAQEPIALYSEQGSFGNVKIFLGISNEMSIVFGFFDIPRKVKTKKTLKKLNEFDFKGKKTYVNEAKQEQFRKPK